MEVLPVKSWKLEFARSTEVERYRDIMRRHQEDLRRGKEEEDKKDRKERQEALEELAFVAMASQTDIDAYLVTTAHYQEATYEAIVQNQELLDAVRRERQEMLEKAYVLPDGRHVFESEDGNRVFDEHGVEIAPSVISADEIEDWRPKHERFQALGDQEAALVEEQPELFEYQQKIEEAQERLEAGEISQKDFDAMKKDLAETMPDRVRENLPEADRPKRELEQQPQLTIEAMPVARPGPVPGLSG